jgi:hypothetical protein
VEERILYELFLSAFAGGEGSNLYRALVDQKTRTLDVGATGVWSWVSPEPGQATSIGLDNIAPGSASLATVRAVRDLVLGELRAVAALPDGSPQLRELGARVKARAIEQRRALDKMLDTPPQFGQRGTYDGWIALLADLGRDRGSFDRSLTRRHALDRAIAIADTVAENPWRERIARWGLFEEPYGLVTRASPAVRRELDEARASRAAAELTRLTGVYGTADPKVALEKRKAEIAEGDRAIARAEATVPMPPLVANPPMTDDDLLDWREEERRGVPVVSSTIETMKSATVGLALALDTVPEALLPYIAILPSLIEDVGVLRDGTPIPYDELQDRLRREVLGLDVYFSTNMALGRAEIVFEASGNDVEETRRAIGWMRDLLASPDWRPANLPRIRDLVGQRATQLHGVMSRAEESWVESVEQAYWRQDRPLLFHTGSVLTRAHDAYRLSWMLAGGDAAFAHRMEGLAHVEPKVDRAELAKRIKSLEPKGAHGGGDLDRKAASDLAQLIADVPDASLAADWAALCRQIAADARKKPPATLEALQQALALVRHTQGARAWVVGSSRHQQAISADVDRLLAGLDTAPVPRAVYSSTPHVLARAAERGHARDAAYVGLVNPSTANGALSVTAPLHVYDAGASDDALVDYLSANVFNGTGAHSFYKRIWGSGLAYSGYAWSSPRQGRYGIYSDRCADLPQLLRFLGEVVRSAPEDARFVDYVLARAFGSRVADSYESRARGIATDIADGFPPERVKDFRRRILAIRSRPDLAAAIHSRLVPVFGALLPTLPPPPPPSPSAQGVVHFVVGPEAQLAAYERELAVARPPGGITRLYPRDFW